MGHIFVLRGEQGDDSGRHGGAHRVWSDSGCLVLVTWNRAVSFV